jgi:methylglutaconyl-CoA hydratase
MPKKPTVVAASAKRVAPKKAVAKKPAAKKSAVAKSTTSTVELQFSNGIALVWLNRPELRNAFNPQLIAEITKAFEDAAVNPKVRAVVLAGHGPAFSAGGDLNWMKQASSYGKAENEAGARAMATMLNTIATCPKPVVARVHGAAFAGGMGLVAACDIAVASFDAKFALTEVKLGLTASTISPYVVRAMGAQQARRYFLTGEVFDVAEAYRIGFVHDICPAEELDQKINGILGHLVAAGPNALTETKRLLAKVSHQAISAEIAEFTAVHIATTRAGKEAQEGMRAFFEKRPPSWT